MSRSPTPSELQFTEAERAEAFEWLRGLALNEENPFRRYAAAALTSWHSALSERGMTPGTPPKDGRAYLAFFQQPAGYVADQRFVIVHWSGGEYGRWAITNSGHSRYDTPTHWMPLPEAPNVGS